MNQHDHGISTTAPSENLKHSMAVEHATDKPPCRSQNISSAERWVSMIAGSTLLLGGLARGKIGGVVAGLIGASLIYRGTTGHCYTYEMLGIDTKHPGRPRTQPSPLHRYGIDAEQGVHAEASVIVRREPEELYDFWRDIANLPQVMSYIRRIDRIDAHRSRWVADGPAGVSVSWEAEIFYEQRPDAIAWRSLPGGEVETAGNVRFVRRGDHEGTDVHVEIKYAPPAGTVGAAIAAILGRAPQKMLQDDLHRFKKAMESSTPTN